MIQRIAVFGATGRTGEVLVAGALAHNWRVRALCRPGRRPRSTDDGLVVVQGKLTDETALSQTLAGCQAACCVFGPRPPYTDLFCAEATKAIIAALRRAGITRVICQTGAMIGPYARNRSIPFEMMARAFARRAPAAAEDRWRQEIAVRESGLDWTVIKPPRLTDAPGSRRVQAGPQVRVGILSRIRRTDLAQLILDELANPRSHGQTIFVKG